MKNAKRCVGNKKNDLGPAINFGGPNERVLLGTDTASIQIEDRAYSGKAEVRLDFLPRGSVHIDVQFDEDIPIFFNSDGSSVTLMLTEHSVEIESFLQSFTYSTSKACATTWFPMKNPIQGLGNDDTELNCIIFHLINFKNFTCTSHSYTELGNKITRLEPISLQDDTWSIDIGLLQQSADNFKTLKSYGGDMHSLTL